MSFVITRCYYFLALHFPLYTPFFLLSSFLSFCSPISYCFLLENNICKITSNNSFVCKLKISLILSTHLSWFDLKNEAHLHGYHLCLFSLLLLTASFDGILRL